MTGIEQTPKSFFFVNDVKEIENFISENRAFFIFNIRCFC